MLKYLALFLALALAKAEIEQQGTVNHFDTALPRDYAPSDSYGAPEGAPIGGTWQDSSVSYSGKIEWAKRTSGNLYDFEKEIQYY